MKPQYSVLSESMEDIRGDAFKDVLVPEKFKHKRVLVIYTGGTIGMVKNKDGVYVPEPGRLEFFLRGHPHLNDVGYHNQMLLQPGFDGSLLVLPETADLEGRILYKILEYENLLDSSNICESEWIQIARDVDSNYANYDGFVVLHGTDTLSYTASALSFMFENLGKPVIVTGSQIPIFEARSDGPDNMVSSLFIAGSLDIPEVTVFFGRKLLRGNRTRKLSSTEFDAFSSPSFSPLLNAGIDMGMRNCVIKPERNVSYSLHAHLSKNVGLLRIYPTINAAIFRAFCQPPIEGVVIESYGAGNMPSNRRDIFDEITAAVKRGVIFVNITQCITGAVASATYETGQVMTNCGVVPGHDMTAEAALTKLAYVLTKTELSYEEKVKMMTTNIRGELTNTNEDVMELDDKQSMPSSPDQNVPVLNAKISPSMKKIIQELFNSCLRFEEDCEIQGSDTVRSEILTILKESENFKIINNNNNFNNNN